MAGRTGPVSRVFSTKHKAVQTMISILVIADAHIGRYPSRVPVGSDPLSVRAVWDASIETAIQRRVDAVVLAGDIVDSENKYFEAYGTIRRGIEALNKHGIPVYAVSGNHDHDVFPRLAREVGHDRFHFLGEGGQWETKPLMIGGRAAAWFSGWSFPSAHYAESPLGSLQLPSKQEPIIGIVHGDVDAAESPYAPLALRMLQRQPVSIWLLGHVHKPAYWSDGGTPVLYPGSLQPLSPKEHGARGPWLVRIDPGGRATVEQLPLASVHYAELSIDLQDEAGMEDVDSRIATAISRHADRLSRQNRRLRHISYRLWLKGTTSLHRELVRRNWSGLDAFESMHGDATTSVNKVHVGTIPVRNLENIARFHDPPATVARWVLELKALIAGKGDAGIRGTLLKEATEAANRVLGATRYRQLGGRELDRPVIAELLVKQGSLLVDALMAQKEQDNE